jgi:hypothetical protein
VVVSVDIMVLMEGLVVQAVVAVEQMESLEDQQVLQVKEMQVVMELSRPVQEVLVVAEELVLQVLTELLVHQLVQVVQD